VATNHSVKYGMFLPPRLLIGNVTQISVKKSKGALNAEVKQEKHDLDKEKKIQFRWKSFFNVSTLKSN
jgi:hypothetical protein